MDVKYFLKVFIVVFLILSTIIFINSIGLNLNVEEQPKKLLQVVTLEGLTNNPHIDTSIIIDNNKSFCESHRGSSGELDKSCNNLTQNKCGKVSCCVWTSDNVCVAGSERGPTFNTDSNGKTKSLDYYFFEGKKHGL